MSSKDIESTIYHLKTPVSSSDIEKLKLGDIIYLSGILCTGRDQVHKRILEYSLMKKPLPKFFETVKGSAIYHMGPIIHQRPYNSFEIVSGGPTTSSRMNKFQTDVCKILDLKFVIGKGGMKNVCWNEVPAVYLAFPGGAGAIASKFFQDIIGVEWLDLGPPEAAWFIRVHEFGPLTVAIDSKNQTLYH